MPGLKMPDLKMRRPAHPASEQDRELIACALRPLDAEAGGLTALAAAIAGGSGLGSAFVAAVAMIRAAQGRVIISGMGKSGHNGHKIAATLSSTGTPVCFS